MLVGVDVCVCAFLYFYFFFFFNDTATTEIYTLSLHDALPIIRGLSARGILDFAKLAGRTPMGRLGTPEDRKSTRLNSSHLVISYAVFCLKKKNTRRRRRADRPSEARRDSD